MRYRTSALALAGRAVTTDGEGFFETDGLAADRARVFGTGAP
jgi:hypothetical protein